MHPIPGTPPAAQVAGDVCWLTADKLDLPQRGAVIPCERWLSQATLDKWISPSWMARPPPDTPPGCAMMCTKSEWLRALRKLDLSSLLVSNFRTMRMGSFCFLNFLEI